MWGIGEAIEKAFRLLIGTCIVAVPLAIWKAIDIIVWLAHHVSFGWH